MDCRQAGGMLDPHLDTAFAHLMEASVPPVAAAKFRNGFRRIPSWLRAVSMLFLSLLGAGVLAASLTPADVGQGEFLLGLAMVHVLFGFAYGGWWAAAGSLLWVPLGLIAIDESDLMARVGAVFFAVGIVALVLAAGVAVRKSLRRSARWRAFEARTRDQAGALNIRMAMALGLVLAGSMWAADALTGVPLIVLLVAAVGSIGVQALGPRAEEPAPEYLLDRLPSTWMKQPWKRLGTSMALVCVTLTSLFLLIEVAVSLGMSDDGSHGDPPFGSATVWALVLLFYVIHAIPRALRSRAHR